MVNAPNGRVSAVRNRGLRLSAGWGGIGILLLAAWLDFAGCELARAQTQSPATDKSRKPAGPPPKSLLIRESRRELQRAGAGHDPAPTRLSSTAPIPTASEVGPPAPEPAPSQARRFRIRDESGNCVVARLHGQYGGKTALVQPDGQLGFPNRLVPTDEPFVPMTNEALQARLQEGPYVEYQVLTTPHYLIFYQSTFAFAQDSGRLLEEQYKGLIEVCRKSGIAVHETEFPLVAVIFATERDFRAHKQVEPEVQAYYEYFTNRIFFYQQSDLDRQNPKVSALRKPQTVAHEGAHQILSNIGVQPRLSLWPLWLIEGLAEYCATPSFKKKGVTWDRPGTINALHMATLRELDDPLAIDFEGGGARPKAVKRDRLLIEAESLIPKTRLTPTDYAQAWALTHYLAQRPNGEFVKFLKSMSQMPPLEPRTSEEHLTEFRKFFGQDLARLDKKADEYIRKLSQKSGYDPLPYYVVIFEQPLGGGMIRRAATYSQSPQMIEQWVQQRSSPDGGIPNWQAFPYPTRTRAISAMTEWMRSNQ
ncbi:MAG: DUF1570 domain-containing protein [Isosphaeraceae bacterium]